MRIGFLVDATCDIPDEYIESGTVMVMPVTVRIDDYEVTDRRNGEVTLNFLDNDIARKASEAQTRSLSIQEIRELFLEKLVVEYDYVFCLTVTRERSPIFENATKASFGILNDYQPIRQAAGHSSAFSLRVIDTGSLFAGQSIPLLAGLRLQGEGATLPRIRPRIEHVAMHTHAFAVPPDLYYLRSRARAKGERSVGLMSAILGSALDVKPILYCNRGQTAPLAKARGFEAAAQKLFEGIAADVRSGLLLPVVSLSYGGPVEEMRWLPGYAELAKTCRAHGVELLESLMSLTGIINLGKGVLSAGYAKEGKSALH
ncbi:fatty acid-binding protein DegV [Lysobacter pythonis]|uniref:Fatty acid-binding protein DegV n=1 Tax=Solilutibacter pythonis TaxID=2483112 RepID=A0A3M2HW17_9GAMM|nr:DegV family protein [Lysobacter pythonis]RMH93218.1 fatty acid-binding protein DegV [Lysobacter pythonis]